MRVLVTGGAGFIGSITSDVLLQAGHSVVIIDNLSHGHRAAVPRGAEFVHGDLLQPGPIAEVFRKHRPEAVLHFAGHIQVGESMTNPLKYLDENVQMGMILLRASLDTGVSRVVLSSTANVFDRPDRILIDEKAAIAPASPYGESKHYLERTLEWVQRTHGINSTCLRYFNAAGATEKYGEDHHPETHLIPLLLQVALGQRPDIRVFGSDYDTPDGTCIRDYVHVSDLAAAHVLAIESKTKGSVCYNLGNGSGYSVNEVIQSVRRITGCRTSVVQAPRRKGDADRLVADSSLIRQELGWKPKIVELPEIIESAWSWMRSNPQGYGPAEGKEGA